MARMIATFEPDITPLRKQPLTIGERFRFNVRRLMGEQNLSQTALAERLRRLGKHATQSSLAELLTSDCSPRADWIEIMARAFGVPETEILADVATD